MEDEVGKSISVDSLGRQIGSSGYTSEQLEEIERKKKQTQMSGLSNIIQLVSTVTGGAQFVNKMVTQQLNPIKAMEVMVKEKIKGVTEPIVAAKKIFTDKPKNFFQNVSSALFGTGEGKGSMMVNPELGISNKEDLFKLLNPEQQGLLTKQFGEEADAYKGLFQTIMDEDIDLKD
mgnify:CR=1 FL=1